MNRLTLFRDLQSTFFKYPTTYNQNPVSKIQHPKSSIQNLTPLIPNGGVLQILQIPKGVALVIFLFSKHSQASLLCFKNKKIPVEDRDFEALAVREGFEPSVQLPVRQFSKLFLSATQASHQRVQI